MSFVKNGKATTLGIIKPKLADKKPEPVKAVRPEVKSEAKIEKK